MASYYNNETILFLNGEFVKAADAKMDFYSQSLHYGYSVFEGIRSYKTVKITATYETLKRNNLQDAYIRPVVYAPANMKFDVNDQSLIVIETWAMQPFLGDQLLRVMTSSFQRPNPKAFHIHAKAAGHYVNSILASQEAKSKGYDEALLLDMNGYAAEAPGANLFYEKDGKLVTPSLGNILPGITRATVLELCAELGIEAEEKLFTLEELKTADAAFYCGTAAEVIGIKSLDEYEFPLNWNDSVSRKIQVAYKELVTAPFRLPPKGEAINAQPSLIGVND
jgi:branched-chain amino acid aminotransferase